METSLFISLLNPAIALILASAFFMLWLYQRHRPYLAVLALAYAASAAGFMLQRFTLPIGHAPTKLLSGASFTLAAVCLAGAIVARYGREVPRAAIGIIGSGGLAAFAWFMFVEADLTWRIFALNFAFGGISLVVAAELRAVPDRGPVENILLCVSLLSGLNFFARPLVVIAIHGPYETYEGFYYSIYWTSTVFSQALFSLLIALSLFTAEALDVLKTLRSESHTDPLSGLLNRRGFEARAAAMLDRCTLARLPVALIIADLDRFKALNDRHGHAAGDRVIVEFAARLRMAAGTRGVAGRLGGEEFAVLLPLADPAAARLLAEAVRAVFSAEPINGLPLEVRATASFGVATRSGDESFSDLMRRTDEALYHAKKGGRDSVRVSYQRALENLPLEPRLRTA